MNVVYVNTANMSREKNSRDNVNGRNISACITHRMNSPGCQQSTQDGRHSWEAMMSTELPSEQKRGGI